MKKRRLAPGWGGRETEKEGRTGGGGGGGWGFMYGVGFGEGGGGYFDRVIFGGGERAMWVV